MGSACRQANVPDSQQKPADRLDRGFGGQLCIHDIGAVAVEQLPAAGQPRYGRQLSFFPPGTNVDTHGKEIALPAPISLTAFIKSGLKVRLSKLTRNFGG